MPALLQRLYSINTPGCQRHYTTCRKASAEIERLEEITRTQIDTMIRVSNIRSREYSDTYQRKPISALRSSREMAMQGGQCQIKGQP